LAYACKKTRGIHHVCLRVPDLKATVTFYQDALDAAFVCGAKPHQEPRYSEIPTRAGELVKMGYAFVRSPGGELVEFIQDHMNG